MRMKELRRTFSYANVVATVALFLAVSGGVVYAASTLGKNTVKSKNTTSKVASVNNAPQPSRCSNVA